jgi:hypothetical protein
MALEAQSWFLGLPGFYQAVDLWVTTEELLYFKIIYFEGLPLSGLVISWDLFSNLVNLADRVSNLHAKISVYFEPGILDIVTWSS